MRRGRAAAAALMVLVLTGCASPTGEASVLGETTGAGRSGTVAVFAAASLTETFDELADEFEAANPGIEVALNYGGSSTLAAQIVQGAPADVFAAANSSTMQTVVDADLVGGPTSFATNTLEIVVPAGNPGRVTGLADLGRPELTIALCAAEVPCGEASEQVLATAGITASPDTLEQDVKAVLTKVQLGEVDAGLVYRTDIRAAGDAVEGIGFNEAFTVVNSYPIAAVTRSGNPDAARAFVSFVLSADARRVFDKAGFGVPE